MTSTIFINGLKFSTSNIGEDIFIELIDTPSKRIIEYILFSRNDQSYCNLVLTFKKKIVIPKVNGFSAQLLLYDYYGRNLTPNVFLKFVGGNVVVSTNSAMPERQYDRRFITGIIVGLSAATLIAFSFSGKPSDKLNASAGNADVAAQPSAPAVIEEPKTVPASTPQDPIAGRPAMQTKNDSNAENTKANRLEIDAPQVKIGDQYTFEVKVCKNGKCNAETSLREVTEQNGDRFVMRYTNTAGNGMTLPSRYVTFDNQMGFLGNEKIKYVPALPYYQFPLYVSKTWSIAPTEFFTGIFAKGEDRPSGRIVNSRGEVLGRERISTRAGFFDTWKVTYIQMITNNKKELKTKVTSWYAPQLRKAVKIETEYWDDGQFTHIEYVELLSARIN